MQKSILVLMMAGLLAGCGGMGSGSQSNVPAQTGSSVAVGNPDVLRVGDIMTIRLSGIPTPDIYEEKVDDDGNVSMPLVGKFKAAGLTTSQLKSQIEQAYVDQRIYATPSVTIIPESRFVNVNGEVRSPSRVVFTNDLTALGAISSCGGFTDYAEKHSIRISRGGQVIFFNAVAAMQNPALDIPMQAGDQIQVARTIF